MGKIPRFSGSRLLQARLRAGLSRQKLAQEIGFIVGPQTIVKYERRGGCPSLDAAIAIVKALNIKLKDILENGNA